MPAERRTVGLMLALALIVRLLVPNGWMPEIDVHGVRLSWCGSAGPPPPAFVAAMAETAERLAMHHGHHGPEPGGDTHGDHKKPGGDQPCAYAGLAFAALDPATAPLDAPVEAHMPAAPLAMVPAVGRGLAAPPPPATGPPHLI